MEQLLETSELTISAPKPLKLNIGAGGTELEGFTPVDRSDGHEAYPLEAEAESVDEIYASHILEHFGHQNVAEVLADWVSKLKPGGRIRIAVPNFQWIAEKYLEGVPIPSQGYVMGAHVDPNDHHGTIFDRESLTELMINAGLVRIGEWEPEIRDCSALPVSLNLQGFKAYGRQRCVDGVLAVLSAPRFGPMIHMQCATFAFHALGINYQIGQGAYWQQVLTAMIEQVLATNECRYVLTCDYDTIFRAEDVLELYRIAEAMPEYSAIVPLQSRRSHDTALFGKANENDEPVTGLWQADFDTHVQQIRSGHFGLTLIRADVFEKIEKPWFVSTPDPDGGWTDKRIDADIEFWHRMKRAGLKVGLANRVRIGHLQEVIAWPSRDLTPVYQLPGDFEKLGPPRECW